MRLATLRLNGSTSAARIDGETAVLIEPYPSLSDLLRDPHWQRIATEAAGRSSTSVPWSTRPWFRIRRRSCAWA